MSGKAAGSSRPWRSWLPIGTRLLALQREAKALRAGVEASVLILTILPFVFLVTLESLAPALLEPFRSPLGELLFGGAVAWMVVGYRVLHQMAAPPAEERVSLRLETEP